MRNVLSKIGDTFSADKPVHGAGVERTLIVCDKPNWSYDSILKSLSKYSPDSSLEWDVAYIKGARPWPKILEPKYGTRFFMGWQLLGDLQDGAIIQKFPSLDPSKILTGIHSHRAWDNLNTLPGKDVPPPSILLDFLSKYRGVNVVSHRLYSLFKNSGLTSLSYTPNGVDIQLFTPTSPINSDGPLRVGFSGTPKHNWLKGIDEFIKPACASPEIQLKLAMPQNNKHVPLQQMPQFYNEIDVYLCASSSEGFSQSVLEASACGRPIISTRVGGCTDLIEDGINGFLVDRNVDAIREKIEYFVSNREKVIEMGEANRRIVVERWSWAKRAPAWINFIQNHL